MSRNSLSIKSWVHQLLTGAGLVALLFLATQAHTTTLFEPAVSDETDDAPEEESLPGGIFSIENVYSPVTQPSPPLAQQIPLVEFKQEHDRGELVLSVPKNELARRAAIAAENRALKERAKSLLQRNRPAILDAISQIPEGIDSTYKFINSRGREQSVLLRGRESVVRDLLNAQAEFHDKQNQLALFKVLQGRLQGNPQLPQTDPDRLGADELHQVNDQMIALLEANFGRDTSRDRKPRQFGVCDAEEGAADISSDDEGDMTGPVCDSDRDGLLNSADWTLKYTNTCVRNQGARGTSTAFAITAATEAKIAGERYRFVNLSEQDLFNQMQMHWSGGTPFEDGFDAMLSRASGKLPSYFFHHEDIWHYNPSYQRKRATNPLLGYSSSCDYYDGQHCSEANHQGRLLCASVAGQRFCGYDAPLPAATPYAGPNLRVIFDIINPDSSLHNARSLLRSGVPVILQFMVGKSFNADDTGFVPMPIDRESVAGGQSVLITGWVPNSQRPANTPAASGGGYFVVKNSWGRCAGDGGYVYLAFDWVKSNALNLVAVF